MKPSEKSDKIIATYTLFFFYSVAHSLSFFYERDFFTMSVSAGVRGFRGTAFAETVRIFAVFCCKFLRHGQGICNR